MKVIKLIIIAIILTMIIFPVSIFIENYHPLNNLSWPMQFPNTQLNMVSNFSGPTNFKYIPIYSGYSQFGDKFKFPYFFDAFVTPPFVIYNNLFIELGILGNWDFNLLYNNNNTFFNISIVTTNINNMLWNFTQQHLPLFKLNYWSIQIVTEPIVYQGIIYFTGTDGYLYALNLKGNLLWEKFIGPVFFTYLFPDENYLYLFGLNFPAWNNTYFLSGESIYKLNLDNKEIVWNNTIKTWIDLTNTSIYVNRLPCYWNNVLYLPLGNILYYINGSDGKIGILGNYTFSFIHYVTYVNNAIYGESENSVVKIDIKNGDVLWKFNVSEPSPCTVYKNIVVFATENGYTYALDADTGKEIWKTQTNLGVVGPVTVASNGIIYEGGENGHRGILHLTSTLCVNVYYIIFSGIFALDINNGKIIDNIGHYYIFEGDANPYAGIIENVPLNKLRDPFPGFYHMYVPKDNVVVAGFPAAGYHIILYPINDVVIFCAVGYIPHYYIWVPSLLVIWVPTTIFIFHKKMLLKKDRLKN
jgi:outer membrane protein assembly factor BamB